MSICLLTHHTYSWAKKMFDIMKKSGEIRLCEALATGKSLWCQNLIIINSKTMKKEQIITPKFTAEVTIYTSGLMTASSMMLTMSMSMR
jgi:hypothetical protein